MKKAILISAALLIPSVLIPAVADAQGYCYYIANKTKCNRTPRCVWDLYDARCEPAVYEGGRCTGFSFPQCINDPVCRWDSEDGRCERK